MCDGTTRSVPLMLDRGSDASQRILMSVSACEASEMQPIQSPYTSSVVYHPLLHANPLYPSIPTVSYATDDHADSPTIA